MGLFSSRQCWSSVREKLHSVLYVKDKFSVSNEAFNKLSMLSNLSSSSEVKNLTRTLNSQFDIRSAPNGIVGVQQSLRARVMLRLTQLVENSKGVDIPSTIRVKLTGDGTEIARGLSVVNINFTVLEEGQRACSAFGNHSIAILKVSENYEDLAAGLEDVCVEAENLEVLSRTKHTKSSFFLVGTWNFWLWFVVWRQQHLNMLVCGASVQNVNDGIESQMVNNWPSQRC